MLDRSPFCKVQLFWEGHKKIGAIFLKVLTYVIRQNLEEGCLKSLWPSHKNWILTFDAVFFFCQKTIWLVKKNRENQWFRNFEIGCCIWWRRQLKSKYIACVGENFLEWETHTQIISTKTCQRFFRNLNLKSDSNCFCRVVCIPKIFSYLYH